MITKKIRKRKSNLFFSIILIFGLLAVISFLVIGNWKMNQRRAELNSRIENLKKEIEELEKKNRELQAGLSQLEGEAYLEKEARERLNLKKPGENVVVVLPPKEGEEKPEKSKNFWEKIWETIKSKF